MSNKIHVKSGDTVMVLSGKDIGKKGKVLAVMPDSGKIIVEGIAMAKRHKKPRSQSDMGGITEKETPIFASKVLRVCSKCGKAARTGFEVLGTGEKVRYCKKCRETYND